MKPLLLCSVPWDLSPCCPHGSCDEGLVPPLLPFLSNLKTSGQSTGWNLKAGPGRAHGDFLGPVTLTHPVGGANTPQPSGPCPLARQAGWMWVLGHHSPRCRLQKRPVSLEVCSSLQAARAWVPFSLKGRKTATRGLRHPGRCELARAGTRVLSSKHGSGSAQPRSADGSLIDGGQQGVGRAPGCTGAELPGLRGFLEPATRGMFTFLEKNHINILGDLYK